MLILNKSFKQFQLNILATILPINTKYHVTAHQAGWQIGSSRGSWPNQKRRYHIWAAIRFGHEGQFGMLAYEHSNKSGAIFGLIFCRCAVFTSLATNSDLIDTVI